MDIPVHRLANARNKKKKKKILVTVNTFFRWPLYIYNANIPLEWIFVMDAFQ